MEANLRRGKGSGGPGGGTEVDKSLEIGNGLCVCVSMLVVEQGVSCRELSLLYCR